MVDITITATLRPDLIRRSLEGLRKCLLDTNRHTSHFRAIVNIDPVGEEGVEQEEIEALYREYFEEIKVFAPETPSFPLAVKRVWEHAESELIFHYEDSKVLKRPVSLQQVRPAFALRKELAALSLRAIDTTAFPDLRFEYDEEAALYVAPFFQRALALLPSFFRLSFVRQLLPFLQAGISPEKTIRGVSKHLGEEAAGEVRAIASQYRYGFTDLLTPEFENYFENAGRAWRLEHQFTKGEGGITSTWVRPKGRVARRKYRALMHEVNPHRLKRVIRTLKRLFRK